MGHVHAAAMAEYAKDAAETDKPWERWEFCHMRGEYLSLHGHPEWVEDNEYRRKPRSIMIGDIEVPEPCKFPAYGQEYFVPDIGTSSSTRRTWTHTLLDKHLLESNLVHLDQQSAALHAKALIEISKGWWK